MTEEAPAGPPPECLPPDASLRRPRRRLPAGTVDCHCHIYESPERFPMVAGRSYTPLGADRAAYLAMCERLGIERTVQVSASVYGNDNRLTTELIAQLGQDRARGVAGLAPDVDARTIGELDEAGMRGVRLSTFVKGYGGSEAIETLAPRIRPFGWHLQVHFHHVDEIAGLEAKLMRLPVPFVFDHLGCVRGGEGIGAPGFRSMLRILRARDDAWVKVSSWYRRSDAGPPGYVDMREPVQAVIDARRERVVWGSNWPHPAMFAPSVVPNDADLLDLLEGWLPDDAARQALFVDNPARLYGFGAARAD